MFNLIDRFRTSPATNVCETNTTASLQPKSSNLMDGTNTLDKPSLHCGAFDKPGNHEKMVDSESHHCADMERQGALGQRLDKAPAIASQHDMRLEKVNSVLARSSQPTEPKHGHLVPEVKSRNEHPEQGLTRLEQSIRPLMNKYGRSRCGPEQPEPKMAELAQDHRTLLSEIQSLKLNMKSELDCLKRKNKRLTKHNDELTQAHASLELNASNASDYQQLQIQQMKEKQSKDEEQIRSLHSQLSALREDVSTMNKVPDQATDDDLRNLMSKLSHDIENWALNGYRGYKIGPSFNHLSEDAFSIIGPLIQGSYLDKQLPKAVICQAIVFSQLFRILCNAPFFELPPTPEWAGFKHLWSIMPQVNLQFNQWRANTLTALFRAPSHDMIAHASQGKLDICNATCSALDELMGAAWDDKRYQQLSRIVDDALAFSRILRCQLASFDVRYYDANMAYDSTFMESNLEDDEAKGGPILLTVAPALVKFGNEYGQRADQYNVICKAKVACPVNESSDDELITNLI